MDSNDETDTTPRGAGFPTACHMYVSKNTRYQKQGDDEGRDVPGRAHGLLGIDHEAAEHGVEQVRGADDVEQPR